MSDKQKGPAFVHIRCDCGCGKVTKIDISKYTRRVKKGLQRDYNIKPESLWTSHRCLICDQNCKSPNGSGTQAALEIVEFGDVHRHILQTLAAHDEASLDELRLYLDVNFNYKTTSNALHSRISELRAWKLIEAIDVDAETKLTGTRYESSPAVRYKLNVQKAELLQSHDWQTWCLTAFDSPAQFFGEHGPERIGQDNDHTTGDKKNG